MIGCLAAAELPLLAAHVRQIWLRPHYQFAPLLLVGAAFLAWRRLREPAPSLRTSQCGGAALAVLSWVLLAAGVVLNSSWLGAVSFLILLAAVLVGLGGWGLLREDRGRQRSGE